MPKPVSRAFGIGALALCVAMGGFWHPLDSGPGFLFGRAAADDDGGGGDDGGDDGGGAATSPGFGGGRSGFKAPRKRVYSKRTPRAQKRKATNQRKKATNRRSRAKAGNVGLPVAAIDEIILRGALESQIADLETRGFKLKAKRQTSDGQIMAKLAKPSRMGVRRARDLARKSAPDAQVDFNHYYRLGYRTQSGDICNGASCKAFSLVGWREQIISCGGLPDIGVIDTKVDASHPSLAQAQVIALQLPEEDRKGSTPDHGTAVAALIAGQTSGPVPGLLPQARLVTVDVFENGNGGDERTDAFVIASALDLMLARGVKVINLSVAGPANDVLKDAVNDTADAGGIVVAAAGNAGPAAPPAYPAAYDGVIAVTAVSDTLAVYRRAGRGQHIDIAAPGVRIPAASQKKAFDLVSGSSFAVPFVTAAVAVQWSQNQSLRLDSSVAALRKNAKDLGTPGSDPVFGAGLLQFPQCK